MVFPVTLTRRPGEVTACAVTRTTLDDFVAVLIEPGASAMVPGRRQASGHSMNDLVRFGCRLIAVATVLLLPLAGALPASAQTLEDALTAHERGDYAAAHDGLLSLSEAGNLDAQFHLGFMYDFGEGIPENDTEALKWWHGAAEQGHRPSQLILGMKYRMGAGIPHDYVQARHWLLRAAAQGDGQAAKHLGYMHLLGEGVPRDHAAAVNWLGRAAARGESDAQFEVGRMYYRGDGLPQDHVLAARWVGLSAGLGQARAQALFGHMHEHGEGVTQDFVKAHQWYNLAASRLSSSEREILDIALSGRDRVAGRLAQAQLAEAQRLAREWQPMFYLGMSVLVAPLANGGDVQLAELQWALTLLGYDVGSPDGILGPKTRAAIRAFQLSAGLPVNGRLSEQLESAVMAAFLAADW